MLSRIVSAELNLLNLSSTYCVLHDVEDLHPVRQQQPDEVQPVLLADSGVPVRVCDQGGKTAASIGHCTAVVAITVIAGCYCCGHGWVPGKARGGIKLSITLHDTWAMQQAALEVNIDWKCNALMHDADEQV